MTFTPTTSLRDEHNDEILTRIFQADSLMPYEYFENSRRKLPLEPEKHLMQAILEDAINTYRLHISARSGRQRKLFLDAQRWIWARNDEWPFSFENICAVLGLDPGFLRNGLLRWKERRQQADVASTSGSNYPAIRRAGR